MNSLRISELRSKLNAAYALDQQPFDPMRTDSPNTDAAIEEMGKDQFSILLSCEDAIREAEPHLRSNPEELRKAVCTICSGYKFWEIHHMAEAIFSASGFSDAAAWDAGHIGIHIDLKCCDAGEVGQLLVAEAV